MNGGGGVGISGTVLLDFEVGPEMSACANR